MFRHVFQDHKSLPLREVSAFAEVCCSDGEHDGNGEEEGGKTASHDVPYV